MSLYCREHAEDGKLDVNNNLRPRTCKLDGSSLREAKCAITDAQPSPCSIRTEAGQEVFAAVDDDAKASIPTSGGTGLSNSDSRPQQREPARQLGIFWHTQAETSDRLRSEFVRPHHFVGSRWRRACRFDETCASIRLSMWLATRSFWGRLKWLWRLVDTRR